MFGHGGPKPVEPVEAVEVSTRGGGDHPPVGGGVAGWPKIRENLKKKWMPSQPRAIAKGQNNVYTSIKACCMCSLVLCMRPDGYWW